MIEKPQNRPQEITPETTSTYSLSKLWQMWRQEALTADQAVGYMLQNLVALEKLVGGLRKEVQTLKQMPKI